MLKRFMMSALLMGVSASAIAADCLTGSPTQRFACLQQQTCPGASSESELLSCYRTISMTLLGEPSAIANAPAPAAMTPPVHWVSATDNVTPAPAPIVSAAQPAPVSKVTAPPPAAAVAQTAPASAPVPSHNPAEDFGLSEPAAFTQKKEVEPDQISAVITQLQKQARGDFLIVLDNGQLWQENEPTRSALKNGQQVKIIKRTLNTYKLVPDKGRSTSVHRIPCHDADSDPRCSLVSSSGTPSQP